MVWLKVRLRWTRSSIWDWLEAWSVGIVLENRVGPVGVVVAAGREVILTFVVVASWTRLKANAIVGTINTHLSMHVSTDIHLCSLVTNDSVE